MRFLKIAAIVSAVSVLLSACATPAPSPTGEQPRDLPDLVAKIDNHAARLARDEIRAQLIDEGVQVYFNLHASELMIRHYYEAHSSSYVRWARYKEYLALNETDEITVAEKLALVETTRMNLHNERAKYRLLRQRLSELTGETFPDEMVRPPKPPTTKPPELKFEAVVRAVKEADVLLYKDPTLPGAKTIEYQVLDTINGINLAWQDVITASATLDHSRKNLGLQQQLYTQEQSVSLGEAMTQETKSEAMLVRATGKYYAATVRLAIYLDMDPVDGLKPDFLINLAAGGLGDGGEQFVPKGGSGFGQEDQNEAQ